MESSTLVITSGGILKQEAMILLVKTLRNGVVFYKKERWMGVVIIGLLLIVLGIIFRREELTPVMCFTIGGLFLAASIIFFLNVKAYEKNMVLAYAYDLEKYQAAIENPKITGEERASVIDMIINDNIIIMNNKMWSKNFWVGIFHSKKVGELEPFDINKIPYASQEIKLK